MESRPEGGRHAPKHRGVLFSKKVGFQLLPTTGKFQKSFPDAGRQSGFGIRLVRNFLVRLRAILGAAAAGVLFGPNAWQRDAQALVHGAHRPLVHVVSNAGRGQLPPHLLQVLVGLGQQNQCLVSAQKEPKGPALVCGGDVACVDSQPF